MSIPLGPITVYGPPPPKFSPTGIPIDWNRDGDVNDIGPPTIDINDFGFWGCMSSPNQVLNGFNDWNGLIYRIGAPEMTDAGDQVQPRDAPPEPKIQDIRQHRILLLERDL